MNRVAYFSVRGKCYGLHKVANLDLLISFHRATPLLTHPSLSLSHTASFLPPSPVGQQLAETVLWPLVHVVKTYIDFQWLRSVISTPQNVCAFLPPLYTSRMQAFSHVIILQLVSLMSPCVMHKSANTRHVWVHSTKTHRETSPCKSSVKKEV